MPLSLFCVGHLLLDMQHALKRACFPNETPMKETKCSFARGYQLEVVSGKEVREGSLCLLLSVNPTGAHSCRPCAHCLSSYVRLSW